MAVSSLSLLSSFELCCDGEIISLPMCAQRLLAFIALQQYPVSRIYAAGALWTEATEDHAAASLRSSLWRLHRPGYRLVEVTGARLRLAPEVEVDVQGAFELAQRILDDTADGGALAAADRALGAELLPDWYDDWVLFERERLRQLGLHALETLAERQIAAGQLRQALKVALAALRSEPLRESAHRLVIRVHIAEGNASEALRQYELCKHLLRDRLALAPSGQLEALVRSLSQ